MGNTMFGGAAVAPNGLVVFAPRNADGVGLFDASAKTFELVSISAQITSNDKFAGAAVAPNGLVVFAPYGADGVGVHQATTTPTTTTSAFELFNIADQIASGAKFRGA